MLTVGGRCNEPHQPKSFTTETTTQTPVRNPQIAESEALPAEALLTSEGR